MEGFSNSPKFNAALMQDVERALDDEYNRGWYAGAEAVRKNRAWRDLGFTVLGMVVTVPAIVGFAIWLYGR